MAGKPSAVSSMSAAWPVRVSAQATPRSCVGWPWASLAARTPVVSVESAPAPATVKALRRSVISATIASLGGVAVVWARVKF